MKILGVEALETFGERHKEAKSRLNTWRNLVECAEWNNPAELKKTLGSASIVGRQTVFNIGGNNYRLVALIEYKLKTVLVQHVLTHAEYDKEDWKA